MFEGSVNGDDRVMSWEKIGVTLVVKPSAHSSGLYIRILKRYADAYELWGVEALEFTIQRVKRKEKVVE